MEEIIVNIIIIFILIMAVFSFFFVFHDGVFYSTLNWFRKDSRRSHAFLLLLDIMFLWLAIHITLDYVSITIQLEMDAETLSISARAGFSLGMWSFIFIHIATTKIGARIIGKYLFIIFFSIAILGGGGGYLWGRHLLNEAFAQGYHSCSSTMDVIRHKGRYELAAPGVSCDVFDRKREDPPPKEEQGATPAAPSATGHPGAGQETGHASP